MALIKRFLCFLWRCFSCPVAVFSGMIAISVISLAGALSAELFMGLEPCRLCVYQRWPFVMAIVIGLTGLALRNNKGASVTLTGLGGLVLLLNSAIAFYHTGVELKWWASKVEGCTVPQAPTEGQSWIDNLMAAPSVPCDIIPWQDPVLGLTMANYNTVMCFGLFVCCVVAAARLKKKKTNE